MGGLAGFWWDLGGPFLPIGSFKGDLGGILEGLGGILGHFGWILGYLRVIFAGSWGDLGGILGHFGGILVVSWGILSS